MHRARAAALAVALAASGTALAACGSSTASSTPPPGSATCDTGSTTYPTIPPADRSPAGTSGTAPTVTVPTGTPPTQLECYDLITGTGPSAAAGDTVTVQYVLATYSSGGVVQSSWTSQPFTFTLGEGQVIAGWDAGVVGMQAGGRRELIIPPSLGYHDVAEGPGIAANDTLVFVVDVLSIN